MTMVSSTTTPIGVPSSSRASNSGLETPHAVRKYSVLYTAKIHNKNPPSQDGVLFYYTQNWRLRLYDCDNQGNMGMEIALDFRKVDLHEGDEFILAGKYRVIVDELLSSEAVVGPPPLGGGQRVPARGREAIDEEAGSSKRKRGGQLLRPGELAHGQSDRALRDVIRAQNESMNEQRRRQGRRGNRQWSATAAVTPAVPTRSSGRSWQQELQQKLEQQLQSRLHEHQKQNQNQQHYQQEQQPPQKRPDRKVHPQSVPAPLIQKTKPVQPPKQQLHHQPEGRLLQPPQQRNNSRSTSSADLAAISRLDDALGDFEDLKFLSEFSDRPDLTPGSDDGDVKVLGVTHPVPVSTIPMPPNTPHQQKGKTPPELFKSTNSSGDKHLASINKGSHIITQLPEKTSRPPPERVVPTNTTSTIKSSAGSVSSRNSVAKSFLEPLRPPSFSKSHFPTASGLTGGLGSTSGGGGLRCLQGISSGAIPRLPLGRPQPTIGASNINNDRRGRKNASKNNIDDGDDFRTISANVLADLEQLEAKLNTSLQQDKKSSLGTKNSNEASSSPGGQGHSVIGVKAGDNDGIDVEMLELEGSSASKSKTLAPRLDELDYDIDEIDFFSDCEPDAAPAALLKPVNNESRLPSSGQTAPARPHNPSPSPDQGATTPDADFEDYDFRDEIDLSFASSNRQPMTTTKDAELRDINPVDADHNNKGNDKSADTQMAEEMSEIDIDERSGGQQDSDLPDDFFEDESEDSGGMLLASSLEPQSPVKAIVQSGLVDPTDDNDGNAVAMSQGPSLSVPSTGTSSVVEIQPPSSSSVPVVAVSASSSTPLINSPKQDSQDPVALTNLSGDAATAAAGESDSTQGLTSGSHQGPDVEETTRSFTEIDLLAHARDPAPDEPFPAAPSARPATRALPTPESAAAPPQHPTKSHHPAAVTRGEVVVAPPPLPRATPPLPPVPHMASIGQSSVSSPLPLPKPAAAESSRLPPATDTLSTVQEITAATAAKISVDSAPLLPPQTSFGRPKKRATHGSVNATITDNSPSVTPSGNNNNNNNNDSNSNSKNNPQFVPPVSRAQLLQRQRHHGAAAGAAAQGLKQKEERGHFTHPVVLVAEDYGAWTAETMDLFSWRPSS